MPNEIILKKKKYSSVVEWARKLKIANDAKLRKNGILVTNAEDAINALTNPDLLTKEQFESMDEEEKEKHLIFWDDEEDYEYVAQDIGLDASLGLGNSVHKGIETLNSNLTKCYNKFKQPFKYLGGTSLSTSWSTITLSDSLDNYDFVILTLRLSSSGRIYSQAMMPIPLFKAFNNSTQNVGLEVFTDKRVYGSVYYVDNTKLGVNGSHNDTTYAIHIFAI